MVDLGTLGVDSTAVAVNESGQVAGTSRNGEWNRHAFSWTPAGMVDLGTLGGNESWATAINDSGQIVGTSVGSDGWWHGFSWTQAGGMNDIGTLGGNNTEARAVNAHGQVVGNSVAPNNQSRAFSWTRDGSMVDLTDRAGAPVLRGLLATRATLSESRRTRIIKCTRFFGIRATA